MRLLISGICGFVGSTIAAHVRERHSALEVAGFDNFIRPGSETNRLQLKRMGVRVLHADVRSATDLEALPSADWVIDAAANPSVLAGVDGQVSSRQLVEHNLLGTINLLEYCKARKAGFILLSTSRVYSIKPLAEINVVEKGNAYVPDPRFLFPDGCSEQGVAERFSTEPPVSLYGNTKLASELLALEYGETFGFPTWINRCGALAGAGQFGRADQGIFSFWINSWLRKRPMKYIGFNGKGFQVRDCLHPRDIVSLLLRQMEAGRGVGKPGIANVSGGNASAMSLAQLSDWCAGRFGQHHVDGELQNRPFDIPWMVLDTSLAHMHWGWQVETKVESILDEIARHAESHPEWLELSGPW